MCWSVKGQIAYQDRMKNAKDSNELLSILEEWEASDSVCPEVYYYLTNIYINKAKPEEEKNIFGLLDIINQKKVDYDKDILQTAFNYSSKGVSLFPDVITLRISNIEVCRHLESYKTMVSGVKDLYAHGEVICNKWLSADENTEVKKQIAEMLNTCYLVPFQDDNVKLIEHSKDIAETVLKYNPDNAMSLVELLNYHLDKGKNKKAEAILKKLAVISDTEKYILPVLALGYAKLGDTINAMEYLRKVKEDPGNSDSYIKSVTEEVMNLLKDNSVIYRIAI
ncbi:hypothetical protein D0T60_17195 [Bacteroides sp. 224]|nr:hypothetical protein [Bacteroides sp. 224]